MLSINFEQLTSSKQPEVSPPLWLGLTATDDCAVGSLERVLLRFARWLAANGKSKMTPWSSETAGYWRGNCLFISVFREFEKLQS